MEEAAATRRLNAAVAAHAQAEEWRHFCSLPSLPSDEARMFGLFSFYRRDEAARCGMLPSLLELCTSQPSWHHGLQRLEASRQALKMLQRSDLFPVQGLAAHALAVARYLLGKGAEHDRAHPAASASAAAADGAASEAAATRRLACVCEMLWSGLPGEELQLDAARAPRTLQP